MSAASKEPSRQSKTIDEPAVAGIASTGSGRQ